METAKVFLISGHSEGQSPYAVMTRPMASEDGPISDCQAWIADNYAMAKPVERMVERSGLNARTFSRRFKAATGFAPLEYVQALRIEEIGRASCRERVGHYVLILVVGVYLKKKKESSL